MEELVFVRTQILLVKISDVFALRVIIAMNPQIRVLLSLYTTNTTFSVDDKS